MEREHPNRDPLFDALRAQTARLDAPRSVEKELMQAFARQFPARRRWYQAPSTRALAMTGGLCAAALGALLVVRMPHPLDGGERLVAFNDDGGPFIALDTPERIEGEPAPRMIATEVPRSSLAALGVPLTPENADEPVRAEMLVAADGAPLALRLTSIN